jgi:hypothetical protein
MNFEVRTLYLVRSAEVFLKAQSTNHEVRFYVFSQSHRHCLVDEEDARS